MQDRKLSKPNASATDGGGAFRSGRKQRVIIHSSPYLRCLQTSVAIGAGMADSDEKGITEEGLMRPLLRVDACLGEWLNPECFEHITPPPSSCMVVSAKKKLHKRERNMLRDRLRKSKSTVPRKDDERYEFSDHPATGPISVDYVARNRDGVDEVIKIDFEWDSMKESELGRWGCTWRGVGCNACEMP